MSPRVDAREVAVPSSKQFNLGCEEGQGWRRLEEQVVAHNGRQGRMWTDRELTSWQLMHHEGKETREDYWFSRTPTKNNRLHCLKSRDVSLRF